MVNKRLLVAARQGLPVLQGSPERLVPTVVLRGLAAPARERLVLPKPVVPEDRQTDGARRGLEPFPPRRQPVDSAPRRPRRTSRRDHFCIHSDHNPTSCASEAGLPDVNRSGPM